MDTKLTNLEGCFKELEITASKEEVQPFIQKAYQKAIPHIEIKGFRKGKVPFKMVQKIFGERIEAEGVEDAANDFLPKIIKEQKITLISEPQMTNLEVKDDSYIYTIKFEVIPDIAIEDFRGLEIDEPVHRVSDDEINNYIKELCINNGTLEDAEEITDELFVAHSKLNPIDPETGTVLIDEQAQELDVFLYQKNILPVIKENLMNKKAGDSFRFNIPAPSPELPEKPILLTVLSVKKLIPQELTDEYVTKYTEDKFNNVDDFKQEIGFRLQERWDEQSRQKMENQVIEKLVEMNDFEPPKSLVDSALVHIVEDFKKHYMKNAPQDIQIPGAFDEFKPIAVRTVKWDIIKQEIIKKENLIVEDYDVDTIIEQEAERMATEKEALKKKMMQNPQFIDYILNKKVMDLIIDFATTNEVPFNEDNFQDADEDYDDEDYDDEDYDENDEDAHHHDHDHDHDHEHHHHH